MDTLKQRILLSTLQPGGDILIDQLYTINADKLAPIDGLSHGSIGGFFIQVNKKNGLVYHQKQAQLFAENAPNKERMHVSTGDTLLKENNTLVRLKLKEYDHYTSIIREHVVSKIPGITVPSPVITFSIEPETLSDLPLLTQALSIIEMEDPRY